MRSHRPGQADKTNRQSGDADPRVFALCGSELQIILATGQIHTPGYPGRISFNIILFGAFALNP